jgi:hypothetical protein
VWLVLHNGPRPRVLIEGFLRPLFAAGVMTAAVLVMRFTLKDYGVAHPGLLLLAEIVVGAIVYVGVALVVCRDMTRDLLRVLRDLRKRRARSQSD